MIDQQRPWLIGVTWDSIVGLNRTLCQAQKLEALTDAKAIAAAQESWERARQVPMALVEALTICRTAREHSPFTFNNGNTFAAVARSLVDDSLRSAPAVEAQIIRTTISHYVAGKVTKKELQQVLGQLANVLQKAPAPARATPDLPAPRLTEIRPVA